VENGVVTVSAVTKCQCTLWNVTSPQYWRSTGLMCWRIRHETACISHWLE